MGGEIGIISRPGVGSNFWFTIVGEIHRPTSAFDRDLGGVRALIIAATGTSRDVLRHQLTVCDGTCVTVSNNEKALAVLRAETFDVCLVDTQGLDAMAFARGIRGQEATKSLPLVLVSTVERGNVELGEAGIDGLIRKPVMPTELFACVARVTGRLDVSVSLEDQQALESDAWGIRRHDSLEVRQSQKTIAGTRILLAEDHPVNRQVATTMLETLKCRVDVVVDGAQAVDAVQRERYDLAFFDCQMPNLDGFEATRQIRRLEQQGKVPSTGEAKGSGHLPIVALTAYTAPADQALSVESGMDDFVSKPFTLQTLSQALERWVAGPVETAALPPSQTGDHPQHNSTDDAPISEAALERILELDRLNGGGVFARFARTFLEEVPITLEQLRAAVREDDAAGVARIAHALKGATLNVGAEPMARVSRELETLGKNGTTEGAASLATKLDELYLAVEAALEARLAPST